MIKENQFLTSPEGDTNPKIHEHKKNHFKKPFGTMSSLMSSERNQKPAPNCFYCEQPHWSDECRTISALQGRKKNQTKMLHMSLPRTCNVEM